jgi:hypothetical protein
MGTCSVLCIGASPPPLSPSHRTSSVGAIKPRKTPVSRPGGVPLRVLASSPCGPGLLLQSLGLNAGSSDALPRNAILRAAATIELENMGVLAPLGLDAPPCGTLRTDSIVSTDVLTTLVAESMRVGVSVVGDLSKTQPGGAGGQVVTPRTVQARKRDVGASRVEKMMAVAQTGPDMGEVCAVVATPPPPVPPSGLWSWARDRCGPVSCLLSAWPTEWHR